MRAPSLQCHGSLPSSLHQSIHLKKIQACAFGADDTLRSFLAASVPPSAAASAPDEKGHLPLQWAALNGRVTAVRLLLAAGARVDAADASGQTALHWAAVRGSIAAAEELLAAGADVEAADERGYRPVHVAAQHGQARFLARLVLGVGGGWRRDDDHEREEGEEYERTTAAMVVSSTEDPEAAAAGGGIGGLPPTTSASSFPTPRPAPPFLPPRQQHPSLADFDARDSDGRTPLHWSAYKGHADCARLLLALGSSPRAPDNERATPLHWVS